MELQTLLLFVGILNDLSWSVNLDSKWSSLCA